jgi:lysyl-tRNA synthetase, class II
VRYVAIEVNGTTTTEFNGRAIDLAQWKRYSMREAIIKFWPECSDEKPSVSTFSDRNEFERILDKLIAALPETDPRGDNLKWISQRLEPPVEPSASYQPEPLGRLIADLFETLAEEHLIQPTIIHDFPLAVSPLSKVKPDEPDWVERFEFYIGGFEVGNAFSELNDPVDQQGRFAQQLAERQRGDDEAFQADDDYVRALAYGLPPTAGEGIGIDRLTMILTGARSIRDVILFPLMRPAKEATQSLPSQDPTASPLPQASRSEREEEG